MRIAHGYSDGRMPEQLLDCHYTLRHTFASRLLEKGADIKQKPAILQLAKGFS